ncbi:MAG: hypothetical protein HY592_01800 [Candidatus Omnitrophica bacterium]|nr:hypothetical protein [Candidatus Omnitrophota bacterium]
MLVRRTSKNQLTLPKAILEKAGIGRQDDTFEAEYDKRRHAILLRPVRVVIEEKISDEAIDRFEKEALRIGPQEKILKSRQEADRFLQDRLKK